MTSMRFAIVCVALALLGGCQENALRLRSEPATYYVLVDSSRSYFITQGSEFSHTKNAIRSVESLVDLLRPLDSIALAEIQSCSFSEAAELLVVQMPETQRELYAQREPLRNRLRIISDGIQPSGNTDIQGAMLGATVAMQRRAGRKFLIVFSDLIEVRAPRCAAPIADEIDFTGIDVLFVAVKRSEEDERNPAGYLARRREWRTWALERGARSSEVLNDASALAQRLTELREENEAPSVGDVDGIAEGSRRARAIPEQPPPPSPPPLQQPASVSSPTPSADRPPAVQPAESPPGPGGSSSQNAPPPPREIAADSAPNPPMPPRLIARPSWLERPSRTQLGEHYPALALTRQQSGEATLECLVLSGGWLQCRVIAETPANLGFGNAALSVARGLRMAATDLDGHPTAGRLYRFTVPFRVE